MAQEDHIIATESTIVHDDVLNIDRQLIAGQPVPPDLVGAYRAKVGDTAAEQDPGEAARAEASAEGEQPKGRRSSNAESKKG